jgi:acyl transferase domain-containing protein/NAD(P)-dependent dehydrogenase (short-subunit alcohol dehydrogenase family)/acyl carrier protein
MVSETTDFGGGVCQPALPGSGTSTASPRPEGIAIVGMGAHFPGSPSVDAYWKNLTAGTSLLSQATDEELRQAGIDPAAASHFVRSGTQLQDAENFDAKFFGLTRREAEIMDPQHRIFLECAYEAIEHAGLTGDGARVGVFAGCGMNTYMLQLLGNPEFIASAGGYQLMLGNDKDFLATRVAYKLNLRGPALVVQTACSTSLAAVHLACQSLISGECDSALAGGVSVTFPQVAGYNYIPGMILSPDGLCRPFDEQAHGTVPGRGAGVVVLKRLSDAVAAGDTIYAVIAGSAWNNDGSGKVGYTAPSVEGQASVIRAAQAAAGIHPDRIGYVEAHGTGTELGDPIEVAALTEVFGERPAEAPRCVLGSVKANMGHADVAAGVGSLIKATLALHHGIIPATPHFHRANPALGLEQSPFRVSAESATWPAADTVRWAGVSSFGIGGTNVHLCLHSAPVSELDATESGPSLFPISAKTATALEASVRQFAEFVERSTDLSLSSAAFTLQSGRRPYAHRQAVVANTSEELVQLLRKPRKAAQRAANTPPGKVAFLFPGQGAQFAGMAASLYAVDESFRAQIDRGLTLLPAEIAQAIRSAISGARVEREELSAMPTGTAQPLLFLVEYALAMRWMDLGVKPSLLLGHSLGELTAATVAGVFSFEDGLKLAVTRGKLMQGMAEGAMLAVSLPVEEASFYLDGDLWVAAENSPKLTVISGTPSAIRGAERVLSATKVATVRLHTDRAFHSPHMAEASARFHDVVASVERNAPSLPWLSNVSGTWITPEEAVSPQYWADQMTSRVRFAENAATLADGRHFLLEVGPGDTLATLVRHFDRSLSSTSSLGGSNRPGDDLRTFLEAAARVWESGSSLRWERLPRRSANQARKIALPTYPFERERHWIESTAGAVASHIREANEQSGLVKRNDVGSWFYLPTWQRTPAAPQVLRHDSEAVSTWLILEDTRRSERSFGKLLSERLEQKGKSVLLLPASLSSREDLESYWKEHSDATTGTKVGLICCWTLRGVEIDLYARLLSLLQTAQIARVRFAQAEFLLDEIVDVSGQSVEDPQRVVVEGLIRTLPTEFSGLPVRIIDPGVLSLASYVSEADPAGLDAVVSEISTVPVSGQMVAYRGQTRWQHVWQTVRLESPATSKLRTGGTYVITGGVGGIGYVLARHLLGKYNAKVALVGRTVMPNREHWEGWLSEHGPRNPVSIRIERVKELTALGGELLLISADVADQTAMEKAWETIEQKFGAVHGVIHAAGLDVGARIAAQSLSAVQEVLRPKVAGSQVLANLLAGREVDFLLFCSSITAIVAVPGAASYTAANVFQDRYAVWCRQHLGLPAISVNFDAWQEVGMAAERTVSADFEAAKAARLRLAMSPQEGIDVFERALAWGEPQVLVSTVDFQALLRAVIQQYESAPSSKGEVELHSSNEDDTVNPLETRAVIDIWKELLGTDRIDATDNFFELGGHSLLGTQVLVRIREQFDTELSIRAIFEAPTPQALGERIREARPAESAFEVAVPGDREEFEI